jgi:hypothetical protein
VQRPHQEDGGDADADGPEVDRPAAGEGEPQPHQDVLVAAADGADAEQVVQLTQRHQQAGAGHEAEDDRLGDVARQVAQPQQRDDDLDQADEHGQQAGHAHPLVGVERGGDGAEDDQRDGVGRAVDEAGARPEQRRQGGHDDGGVQAVEGG